MVKLIILGFIVLVVVHWTEQTHFLSNDYIKQINENAKTWKAKQNFPQNTSREQIMRLLGSKILKGISKGPVKEDDRVYEENKKIPKTFDARKHWRNCKTIGEIRNQGNCGSCWAHGTTGAFADRLCVATKGEFNQLISAEELTFCCYQCGFACYGGNPIEAWKYFETNGIVTGGNYNTTEGCQPYRVPPCIIDEQGHNSCDGKPIEDFHECPKTCYGNQTVDYKTDHHRTKDSYFLSNTTIQKDVVTFGPVEASFEVYDDFMNYGSGVYQRTAKSTYLGAHSVKLIGWGKEYGVPYWLMVNSWGEQWGDQGLFKILRGKNECRVEESCTAGVPRV